ncbi:MAG TPA: ParB/RepB/Spo0J family partition protein [Burkholderiaceae bacterium]|nr:ParB/RepB/Spo0J family partition protein [Burkholderiaceae bacterium]
MNRRPKGLGRGLDALLGESSEALAAPSTPRTLPLTRLRPGKYQPRTNMDPTALAELADSIRSQGIIQPILVRPIEPNLYEIIAGERRFRAAAIAGLSEVPVQVRECPDEAALALALIENIQREDLNPLEEAQGVQRLIREFSFSHEQAAAAIGRSRSATSNLLRLLNLAQPVQEMLLDRRVDMGHARALLAVDGATQVLLAEQIAAKALSVRAAEDLVRRALAPQKERVAPTPNRDLLRLEEELSDVLATPVAVRAQASGKGHVVIDFASLEQLQGIIERLRGRGAALN